MSGFLDVALAVHPPAWRERYAEEVRGTLMDVADEAGGKVPLSETVPLGLRGLWLRGRGSVTFWGGLVVVGLLVSGAITADVGYLDGSLPDFLLRINAGLGYALPVLAIASGWAGARARIEGIVGPGRRLGRFWADTWPLLAFTVVGYLLAIAVFAVRAAPPWFTGAGVLVFLGQAAMVCVALAVGQLLGAVLPRVLVIFAAPIAVLTIATLLFASQTPWNTDPWGLYPGLAYVFEVDPFTRIYVIAGVIVACAILSVAIRNLWVRALPALLLVGICIGVAAQPAPLVDLPAFTERPRSELICSTVEPVVCLWPEQEAAFGASLRSELTEAYAKATALGLPVEASGPRSVAHYGMTAIPAPANADWDNPNTFANTMGLGTAGIGPDDLLAFWAFSLPSCCWEQPTSGDGDYQAVAYATSILLGVPPEKAWPAMIDPYTGQRQFNPSGIPDEAAARALVEQWLAGGVNGVRAP